MIFQDRGAQKVTLSRCETVGQSVLVTRTRALCCVVDARTGGIHDTCFLIATSPTTTLMTVSQNPLSAFYEVHVHIFVEHVTFLIYMYKNIQFGFSAVLKINPDMRHNIPLVRKRHNMYKSTCICTNVIPCNSMFV